MTSGDTLIWAGIFIGAGFAIGIGAAVLSWMLFNSAWTWASARLKRWMATE